MLAHTRGTTLTWWGKHSGAAASTGYGQTQHAQVDVTPGIVNDLDEASQPLG
jgi:hypothetical protein